MKPINIKGTIIPSSDQWVYDWLDLEATSPKKVHAELEQYVGQPVEVNINSPGGDVWAGSEIYSALKSYSGKVTVKIVGIAASAASVIAMGGDVILMSPTSQMMIHNAWTSAAGDYREMDHRSQVLRNVNETLANAYALKSGLSKVALLKYMDAETWFTPQQALKLNLIDGILYEESGSPVTV